MLGRPRALSCVLVAAGALGALPDQDPYQASAVAGALGRTVPLESWDVCGRRKGATLAQTCADLLVAGLAGGLGERVSLPRSPAGLRGIGI